MSEPFVKCRKCGHNMVRVSPENSSPLILECQKCGHKECAEIQIAPPWPPGAVKPLIDTEETNDTGKRFRFLDVSAMPVSAGPLDKESTVIPFGWILLWIMVIAVVALLLWIIF
jgi:hypothetical protein